MKETTTEIFNIGERLLEMSTPIFKAKEMEPTKNVTLEEIGEQVKEIAIEKLKDEFITREEYMILVENHNKSIKKITSALSLFAEQLNHSRKRIERLENETD